MTTQPNVTSSQTLDGLFFTPALGTSSSSATSACGGYVLTAAPGAALTLTASGYNHNGVYMLEQCTTGSNIIAAPIAFPVKTTESHHFVNVVSGTLEFSGPLTGDSNNVLRVGGTAKFPAFILSGDNSGFTGGFVKAGGFPVIIRNSKALSKTTRFELSVHGAQPGESNRLINAGGALSGAGTMAGNITVESNGVFRINSALATGALGKNLILNDGARMDVVLGGGNGVGYVLEGSSQRLWNYGAVVCNVSTLDEDVTSGSFTLMNWSGATTPDISKLNAANFSIANPEDFSGVFAIEGDALVLHYRNLALKPLLIVVR